MSSMFLFVLQSNMSIRVNYILQDFDFKALNTLEFSLNVFTEFAEFSDKKN